MENSEQPISPVPHINDDGTIQYNVYTGLTKREYFAAMALQGLMANSHPDIVCYNEKKLAEWSVQYADELLKQLEEK